tara:strand:+ start:1142 stop:1438 length:297 start_codon:yes stop_codon:yes gene_type:complete
MILTNDIKEILENVLYWETCPQEYKDKINDYMTSENETALNIDLVMWRCTKDLFMDSGEKVFTKGKVYKQVDYECNMAYDDSGEEHSFGDWKKHFIST